MKVLYVMTNSFWYGDNKALYNLLPHLIKFGIKPIFLIPRNSLVIERLSQFSDIIIPYNENNIYYTQKTALSLNIVTNIINSAKCIIKTLFADKKEYINIRKQVSTENPDIIHTNNSGCILGYRLAISLCKPHVWHIREYGDKDANWKYFPSRNYVINRFNSYSNFNITITEGIRNYFGLSSSNSITIYDGPISIKTLPKIEKEKNYFLFVGRLFPNKGVDMLIEAMSKVIKQKPWYKLKIAGSGEHSYVTYIRNKVSELGLCNNIELLGYREDIASLMSHAIAVIVPSYFEAFGFITTEAMFYGSKVIGFDSAGTKEQMDNVENALGKKICSRFHDSEELSREILDSCNEKLDIETLQNVSKYVLSTYSDEKSSKEVYNYYLKIINLFYK